MLFELDWRELVSVFVLCFSTLCHILPPQTPCNLCIFLLIAWVELAADLSFIDSYLLVQLFTVAWGLVLLALMLHHVPDFAALSRGLIHLFHGISQSQGPLPLVDKQTCLSLCGILATFPLPSCEITCSPGSGWEGGF